jgi:hypothetical protein
MSRRVDTPKCGPRNKVTPARIIPRDQYIAEQDELNRQSFLAGPQPLQVATARASHDPRRPQIPELLTP